MEHYTGPTGRYYAVGPCQLIIFKKHMWLKRRILKTGSLSAGNHIIFCNQSNAVNPVSKIGEFKSILNVSKLVPQIICNLSKHASGIRISCAI